jgi:hypothetical protein
MADLRTLIPAIVLLWLTATSGPAAQRAPAPGATGLAPDVLALACAPRLVFDAPETPLVVTGGQDTFFRRSYHPGDLVTINAGREQGMEVGREYFVRRVQVRGKDRVSRLAPATIRTTGWVRIWAVDDLMSLATITHACDSVEPNDYLEPFQLPSVPEPGPRPPAEKGNYGRVLSGADRRTSFGRGDFLIVDRGSMHGVVPGTQFVIYRDKQEAGNFLYELGEAVAMDVQAETATLHVTLARDAFLTGDLVAIRRGE